MVQQVAILSKQNGEGCEPPAEHHDVNSSVTYELVFFGAHGHLSKGKFTLPEYPGIDHVLKSYIHVTCIYIYIYWVWPPFQQQRPFQDYSILSRSLLTPDFPLLGFMRHTQRMNLFWGQTLPASTATWLRTLKNLDLNIAMIWKSLTSGGWVQDPRLWDWETWFSTTFLGAFLFGNPKTKLRHLQQIWGPWVWVDINLYPLVSSSFWSSPNSLWFLNAAGDVGISRIQNSPWSKEPHAKILLVGHVFVKFL